MYSSLHNHSEYSVLDGFGHPKDYLERAQKLGLKAFAITEHGNQYSWVYFDQLAKQYPDVKMIYGVELYECFDINEKEGYFHLIALAKNERGRIALNEIITRSNFEGFYYKPRVDLNMLRPYANDLIVTTACLASKIAREEDVEIAVSYAREYKSIFPHFYLEMQSHNTPDQRAYNQKILTISKLTGIPFVITTDSHAATEEDLQFQSWHVRIARDKETEAEIYSGCYLQSEEEIHEIMDVQIGKNWVDIGLENTNIIADLIDEVHMPWQEPQLPTFPLPQGFETNTQYLRHLCQQGWKYRQCHTLASADQEVRRKRMEYELSVIDQMGYSGYFLIVWDYIKYAKENNIIVGDGRGSGGGSFVVFLLGISELDPVSNNLIFERFLNPERVSMPDIDVDFADRGAIISYLIDKYGESHVCQILNINYITPNVAIKDVGRVLGIPYSLTNKIASKFTYDTFDECIKANQELVENYASDCGNLFNIAAKISGRVRNVSMHAGGVCIFDKNVTDYMGMKLGGNNEHIVQVDKKQIEALGGVKFDILGVKTLMVVQEAANIAGLTPEQLSINNPEFANDIQMYELLCSAKTNGIFQTESQGMKDLLIRLQPSSLEDVSAVLALYRPDSMPLLEDFIYNKHHPDEQKFVHPDMQPILEPTYGCMIYQEELMDVVRKFGGRSYGGADKFRKGIGKKDKELIKAESEKLYQEIIDNGYDESLASTIASDLSEKGGYLFNHCVSGDTYIMRGSCRQNQFVPTVAEMYRIKNDAAYARATNHIHLRDKYRSKIGYGTAISMRDDQRCTVNQIVDIRYAGKRKVFKVQVDTGGFIKATGNHKFPTPNGEKLLSELSTGDQLYVIAEYEKCKNKYNYTNKGCAKNYPQKGQCGFRKQEYSATNNFENTRALRHQQRLPCEMCGCEYDGIKRFELHHSDFNRQNNDTENFSWLCVSCHKLAHYQHGRVGRYEKGIPTKLSTITSIEELPEEDVYDIEMADPYHNFVISTGIVTCNSHSALYSILTLKTAYLKAHHPTAFFCALFNQNKNDYGALNKYLIDSQEFGVETIPPHINKSERQFSVANGKIRFGLEAIRGIGENIVDEIMAERANGKFTSLDDLTSRIKLSTANVVALIKAGAIPCSSKHDMLLRYAKSIFPAREYKPVSTYGTAAVLLNDWGIDVSQYKNGTKVDKVAVLAEYNLRRKQKFDAETCAKYHQHLESFKQKYMADEEYWEFEALSVFLSDNPFKEAYKHIRLSFDEIEDGGTCVVVGIISGIQNKKDRNKNKYAFINLNASNGLFEVTCWAHQYKQYEELIKRGSRVAVLVRKNADKAIVEAVKPYETWLSDRKLKLPH